MEKHNPSSSPVHRSETVDRSAFENRLSFSVHDLYPYINWIYFFHAWGFQPRYAAIANIHGCDACRASWLTTFPEEERGKAVYFITEEPLSPVYCRLEPVFYSLAHAFGIKSDEL